jgi:hypothetical protein
MNPDASKAHLIGCPLVRMIPAIDTGRPPSHAFRLMHQCREQQSLEMHRRIAARLERDPDAVLAKALANLGRWHERHRGSALEPVFQEWRELLGSMSPAALAGFIAAEDERATRMRQSSPFAGVLSPREVWAIKKS